MPKELRPTMAETVQAMVIYRCPRGHTRGAADFHSEMVGQPTCAACLQLGDQIAFMERVTVIPPTVLSGILEQLVKIDRSLDEALWLQQAREQIEARADA